MKVKKYSELNNESADFIESFKLRCNEEDAHSFMMYNNKIYLGVRYDIFHSHLLQSLKNNNQLSPDDLKLVNYAYSGDKIKIPNLGRKIPKFPGRLWSSHKIISFWSYPNKNEINEYLEKLQSRYNMIFNEKIDFFDGEWQIEVFGNYKKYRAALDDGEYYEIDKTSEVIPLEDYEFSFSASVEEINALHLLKPEEKKKILMDSGYRAKSTKWKKYMKPFESFLF